MITISSLSLRLGLAISFKSVAQIVPKQAETKWNGEINPQNLNVEKILCCQNGTNQPKSNVELAYIYPGELLGLPAMELIIQNKEKI